MRTSKETISAINEAGQIKASLPFTKLLILAILAGAYIGFGAHLSTVVGSGAVNIIGYGLSRLLVGLTFSLGLILVVIAGAELFTGNTLMVTSVLTHTIPLSALFRNWLVVYLGNLIGSVLIASLVFFAGMNGDSHTPTLVGQTALSIAQTKASLPPTQIFFRAILANWLVCLAIYLATSAKDVTGKIVAIVVPITAFVAMCFEHSIANMYFLSAGLLMTHGALAPLTFTASLSNLLFATLGNIVGSVLFVVLPYWYTHLRSA